MSPPGWRGGLHWFTFSCASSRSWASLPPLESMERRWWRCGCSGCVSKDSLDDSNSERWPDSSQKSSESPSQREQPRFWWYNPCGNGNTTGAPLLYVLVDALWSHEHTSNCKSWGPKASPFRCIFRWSADGEAFGQMAVQSSGPRSIWQVCPGLCSFSWPWSCCGLPHGRPWNSKWPQREQTASFPASARFEGHFSGFFAIHVAQVHVSWPSHSQGSASLLSWCLCMCCLGACCSLTFFAVACNAKGQFHLWSFSPSHSDTCPIHHSDGSRSCCTSRWCWGVHFAGGIWLAKGDVAKAEAALHDDMDFERLADKVLLFDRQLHRRVWPLLHSSECTNWEEKSPAIPVSTDSGGNLSNDSRCIVPLHTCTYCNWIYHV